MDYNRSGVPLMEIVTAFPPDIEGAEEARLYAETLRSVLLYLGVSDGKMEQGSLRVEPNPSVRPEGSGGDTFGVKTELKNLNSFRSVQRGIEYEAQRQIALLESGGRVVQETRGWDDEKGVSFGQRSKEVEQEYRYFPEPDLIPIDFDGAEIEALRASLPELPNARKRRLMEQYGLPAHDAGQLVAERAAADFFEAAVAASGAKEAKAVANWMLGDLARLANAAGKNVYETPVTPGALAELVGMIESGAITGKIAKSVIEEMFVGGKTAPQVVAEKGLTVSGSDEVAGIVARVVEANPDVVAKIKAGNEKSKGFLVGQVMKETRGRAKPDDVNRLIDEALAAATT
jgi:aspartyl-tRNA(Asn)/glutamyl-tRNA(Gln) amidotransferase subunit B